MDQDILPIDVGFAQSKWRYNGRQGKFPSAVAKQPTLCKGDMQGLNEHTVNGKTLVVGEDACDQFCKQIYEREMTWLIEYLPYFIAQAAREAGIADLSTVKTLSLGLPIEDFTEWKARLISRLENIEINGVKHSFNVLVTQQGVGAMITCYKEKNIQKKNTRGIVIDIGGNTIIIVSHKNFSPTKAGSNQYEESGVSVAAEKIRIRLETLNSKNYSLVDTLNIMRTRTVPGNAAKTDINKEIDAALAAFAQDLVTQINQDYSGSIGGLDHVILAGGGAEIVRPYLPETWPNVIVLDDAEFANVRGYAFRAQDGK